MVRIGVVLEVVGEHARLETSRRGVCEGCADHASCAVEGAVSSGVSEVVTARNPVGAGPGDRVEFDLPGHTELKISLLVWVVPLCGVIAGAIVGAGLHESLPLDRDLSTLLGAVVGAAAAFGVVIPIDRRVRGSAALVPRILKVLPPSACSQSSSIGPSSSSS